MYIGLCTVCDCDYATLYCKCVTVGPDHTKDSNYRGALHSWALPPKTNYFAPLPLLSLRKWKNTVHKVKVGK